MKTAISIPDDLFSEVERLARRLKKSRSQLYREAVVEYLARHDPDAVTSALDAVAAAVGPRADPFRTRAGRRTLERAEW